MARTALQRVSSFALYSRILVFVMQVFFNYLMPDHEASDVFNPPNVHRVGRLDWWMRLVLDGLKRWDALYFLHIAEHGYTYENMLAFFPLFPLAVRLVANTLLLPLQYVMNYATVLLLAAVVLNVYFFVKSARALYQLSELVLGDETLALKTAQLYCINPASIFFTAAYSESSFAFLTFSGLLQYERGRLGAASLWFGASALSRSNGIVNVGFILYRKLTEFARQLSAQRWGETVDVQTKLIGLWSAVVITCLPTLLYVLLCLAPFAAYQMYAYFVFCNPSASYKDLPSHVLNYGNNQLYRMPHTGLAEWCGATLPLSYSHVQAAHWNNGFLRYYELKQLPNFALAAPMVLLCLAAVGSYARRNAGRTAAALGLGQREFYKKYDEERTERLSADDSGFFAGRVFVYVVHVLGLVVVAVLFMHIQVVTRFIACASPVVYWFVATTTTPPEQLRPRVHNAYDIFRQGTGNGSAQHPPPAGDGPGPAAAAAAGGPGKAAEEQQDGAAGAAGGSVRAAVDLDIVDWDKTNAVSKAIFIYFHLYFFVGVAAFSNFLPWT